MYLKICGLRTPELARVAVEAGADAIGLMMNDTSPRRVSAEEALAVQDEVRAAAQQASRTVDTVLVVSDKSAEEAGRLAADLGVDVLQMHGTYAAEDFRTALQYVDRVWRATSLRHHPDLRVGAYGEERLLLDAPKGGSGQTWDLSALAAGRPQGEWLLAGGLNPENVVAAIEAAQPWGVDVSSGVESAPGVKDADLVRAFAAAVRSTEGRATAAG